MIEELDDDGEDDDSGEDAQEPGEVSGREMLVKIIDLASTDGLSDEALLKMVEALEKIVEAYKQKKT